MESNNSRHVMHGTSTRNRCNTMWTVLKHWVHRSAYLFGLTSTTSVSI